MSLDHERLRKALAVLEAETRGAEQADVLLAPLVGLRMPLPRLQLPRGIQIVRADAVEAPVEAMSSEGMGRAAWQPQFLALAEQSEGPESAEAAMRQLHELISVMRLFKAGGIGLGPYAFAPTGEDRWARLATGAPSTRSGGYDLDEDESLQLAELASALEARPDPDGALAWAVARFEMGCDRGSALEGLSDHLLALRAVLEGHGPVGASLPMRASALLACEELDRFETGERIEQAMELERSLMSGSQSLPGLALAGWLEEGVRRILRDAALGELGGDLGTAADETLIVAGLESGDVEIAGFSRARDRTPRSRARGGAVTRPRRIEEDQMEQETRILEPIPAEGEIRITATNWLDEVEDERAHVDFPAGIGEFERPSRSERETADAGRGEEPRSGSTPRACATSSRFPRTRTGRSRAQLRPLQRRAGWPFRRRGLRRPARPGCPRRPSASSKRQRRSSFLLDPSPVVRQSRDGPS